MTEIISRKMKTLGLKLNQMETLVSKIDMLWWNGHVKRMNNSTLPVKVFAMEGRQKKDERCEKGPTSRGKWCMYHKRTEKAMEEIHRQQPTGRVGRIKEFQEKDGY